MCNHRSSLRVPETWISSCGCVGRVDKPGEHLSHSWCHIQARGNFMGFIWEHPLYCANTHVWHTLRSGPVLEIQEPFVPSLEFLIFSKYECSGFCSFCSTFHELKPVSVVADLRHDDGTFHAPPWHLPHVTSISDSLTVLFRSKSNLITLFLGPMFINQVWKGLFSDLPISRLRICYLPPIDSWWKDQNIKAYVTGYIPLTNNSFTYIATTKNTHSSRHIFSRMLLLWLQ